MPRHRDLFGLTLGKAKLESNKRQLQTTKQADKELFQQPRSVPLILSSGGRHPSLSVTFFSHTCHSLSNNPVVGVARSARYSSCRMAHCSSLRRTSRRMSTSRSPRPKRLLRYAKFSPCLLAVVLTGGVIDKCTRRYRQAPRVRETSTTGTGFTIHML